MDPHSRAPKKNTSHGNEVLAQDITHLIQRPCNQRGSPSQDPAGSWTTHTHTNWLVNTQNTNPLNTPFSVILSHHHHHHYHLPLNREGRWGTTDDFATSFFHFFLFSTALWDLPNSRLVHSLILSSHLVLCLPCLLPPFTVPCKMVLARPDERETAVCVSLRSSGDLRVVQLPAGSWHRLPCWLHGLCMRCVVSYGSTSFPWLVFFFGALL